LQPLDEALKKALTGHLEDVALALLKTPARFDADELRAAMKGLGTDEDTLIEILTSRTNKEIREINRVYREELKRDLAKDITSDTSGDFQKALLSLAKGDRSEDFGVNDDLADSDARALYEAGERRKGTDVNVFNTILTTRSYPHLRRVFQMYTKYSKHDMNKVLDLEMKGDVENCFTAIVKCATSKPMFFAEKLHNAMKVTFYLYALLGGKTIVCEENRKAHTAPRIARNHNGAGKNPGKFETCIWPFKCNSAPREDNTLEI
ncbi:annexin A1, partial [Equus quagga]|uniref:annexin A1 n=1 Tax=Equus quagga TaxID=89248 RepID=UPI001EE2C480